MDAVAFEDERVIEAMQAFVPVMVNCTKPGLTDDEDFSTNEECRPLMERYAVKGWPTFIVASPEGDPLERSNFASADGMVDRLQEASRRWKQMGRALDWVDARKEELAKGDAKKKARAELELRHLLERVKKALPPAPTPKAPATKGD